VAACARFAAANAAPNDVPDAAANAAPNDFPVGVRR